MVSRSPLVQEALVARYEERTNTRATRFVPVPSRPSLSEGA